MKKWWVIGSIIIILSVVMIVRYQLNKITHSITERIAADYAIQLQPTDLTLSYFPLALSAKNIHYQQHNWQIAANEITLKFSYLGWLTGKEWIKRIDIADARLVQNDHLYLDKIAAKIEYHNAEHHQPKISLLYAENHQVTDIQGQFILQTMPDKAQFSLQQLALQWQWREPIAQMQKVQIAADIIELSQQAEDLALQANHLQLNSVTLPSVKAIVGKTQSVMTLLFANNGELTINNHKINDKETEWNLQGQHIAATQISQLLGYQPLVLADFDVQGTATQYDGQLAQAALDFVSVGGGQIKGFNILALFGNALPFAISGLEQNLQDTNFEHIEGHLQGNHQQWQLQNGEIVLHDVRLIGQGQIHPATAQCEWQFAIQPQKAEFSQYHLNLDLDGNCLSPTYRIRLDDAIKDKLKSKLQQLLEKL
ncbi:hypothetical protein [Gallibacterium salpingitidis]|uniref:AsmA domain-containing protein n=1 Tax=Gallibacterium salpingitidis TaxID=505341 RepID=A0A1A7NNM1_9PAST|nr:hypothetical protein [Gallibacterium salpingitidis]OBW91210.1 hypothetical protein QS62_10950 [Gallibacterium salpingitidis]